jgi:subtilisin family serine protease
VPEDEKWFGHGTHVGAIIAGPVKPSQGPRYGVAPDAELYVARVLRRQGGGAEGDVLLGIEWALQQKCRVIALPFGMHADTRAIRAFYREVGARARRGNGLLLAAAGNRSNRPAGRVLPASVPAGCTSILGVGAVDARLQVAAFSDGTAGPAGGVDLVAPGVDVWSAWAGNLPYRRTSGTSAAVAFTAGVAALIVEAERHGDAGADLSADGLARRLVQGARRLPAPSGEVGHGLVQAPSHAPAEVA